MGVDWGGLLKRILGLAAPSAGQDLLVRVWEFPPEYWRERTIRPCADLFPEWDRIPDAKRGLGLAFSGGGTRAASATIGQLRGLRTNGWLDRFGYISSVSGGTWAAVPYVYSQHDDETFLGPARRPQEITWQNLVTIPAGAFNGNIANAALDSGKVLLEIVQRVVTSNDTVQGALTKLLGNTFGIDPRATAQYIADLGHAGDLIREQTFASLLSSAFLAGQMDGGENQYFSWQAVDCDAIREANPGVPFPAGFAIPTRTDRPFIIANAAALHRIPGFKQSPVPVEYTPLYCGTRQRIGPALGGNYVWSVGYGTHAPTAMVGNGPVRGYVRATTRDVSRPFSLADVLGSSGAAPEFLLADLPAPDAINALSTEYAAAYFAHLPTWSVRHGAVSGTLRGVPHADGGAIDNLGLLALLARQVTRVIVFVNANEHFQVSDDLRDICGIGTSRGAKEDHGLCKVFQPQLWHEMQRQFNECVARNEPAVCCGDGWEVLDNQIFNVQGYAGLKIAIVYNFPNPAWRHSLPDDVRKRVPPYPGLVDRDANGNVIQPDDQLTRFPWFRTIAEQASLRPPKVQLLALAPQATQLLSHLAWWSITHPRTREKITRLFGWS